MLGIALQRGLLPREGLEMNQRSSQPSTESDPLQSFLEILRLAERFIALVTQTPLNEVDEIVILQNLDVLPNCFGNGQREKPTYIPASSRPALS